MSHQVFRGITKAYDQWALRQGLRRVLCHGSGRATSPHLGPARAVHPEHRPDRDRSWIRLGILETLVFQKLLAEDKIEHITFTANGSGKQDGQDTSSQ
jgi:hypothetical protein